MEKELLEQFGEKVKTVVDNVMEEKLKVAVGPMVASEVRSLVETMRVERALFGKDRSGLNADQKQAFVEMAKAAAFGKSKANATLIEEQDSRGGFLVPKEIADAILRIAATVGVVLNQATKWPMASDELGIPNYTGSFLEGGYLGIDAPGPITSMGFGQVALILKKWQLAFALGNDLLADAVVDLGDWLLSLAAEALANKIDKVGFIGNSDPFIGVLNNPNVTAYPLGTGNTTFDKFLVMEDAANMIAQVEESVLDGAAFYMHRTVWAKLRTQKDGNGNYILPFAGLATPATVEYTPSAGGPRPAGSISGYPVYTIRHLPAWASSGTTSTNFLVFGNFKAAAYGDRGDMTLERFQSGTFDGKEIALADQVGLVFKHRHAFALGLPAAFVVAKTSAS
jgi:HK97 family phage major capsid protein